jgi:hypothetical protein
VLVNASPPLNEVSGVTACCSAILGWLPCSLAEAEQAPEKVLAPSADGSWRRPLAYVSRPSSMSSRAFLSFLASTRSISYVFCTVSDPPSRTHVLLALRRLLSVS